MNEKPSNPGSQYRGRAAIVAGGLLAMGFGPRDIDEVAAPRRLMQMLPEMRCSRHDPESLFACCHQMPRLIGPRIPCLLMRRVGPSNRAPEVLSLPDRLSGAQLNKAFVDGALVELP